MAECDPPEPPPLLREPPRRFKTAAERNQEDARDRERRLEREADFFLPIDRRWGCLLLIVLPLVAAMEQAQLFVDDVRKFFRADR